MESREIAEMNSNLEKNATLNTDVNDVQNDVAAPAETPAAEQPVSEEPTATPAPVEEAPAVEPAPTEPEAAPADEPEPAPVAEKPARVDYTAMGKQELVEALEGVAQRPIDTIRDEVAAIKAAFFALRKEEIDKEKAEFLEKGNEEAAFAVKDDELENRMKEILNELKEKRAQRNAEIEAERAQNLEKKQAIVDKISEITNDPDNINRHYGNVQQLQQEFKAIGAVPATAETEIWKAYQQAVERFYDLLKINKELRDYDFKKNLEAKQQLCAEAEELDEVNDVVAAFRKLQELHNKWREIGPVAKELREDLWARFKNASVGINKKYQAFFEERKGKEKENAEAKTALCEQVEAISTDNLKTYSAWETATKKIIALQEEWKKLGFASRKLNADLFARFRKSCDEFFAKKAEFFKTMKESLAANLARKTELCEKAEALKDSTDWKKTTDELVALQKEWKTIGPVVKKHSDAVWKRFIGACDYFFEQKKKQHTNVHAVEHDNLKTKRELIAKINAALEAGDAEAGAAIVREVIAQWPQVGHVPFKEKDKIYAEYREAVDKAFEQFDMKGMRANLANFESSISQSSGDKVYHERERLVRTYEQKCSELKTYENNMGFFTATSKTGSSLVKEMERRIAKIKEEIALLEQKIKLIDEKI